MCTVVSASRPERLKYIRIHWTYYVFGPSKFHLFLSSPHMYFNCNLSSCSLCTIHGIHFLKMSSGHVLQMAQEFHVNIYCICRAQSAHGSE